MANFKFAIGKFFVMQLISSYGYRLGILPAHVMLLYTARRTAGISTAVRRAV